MANVPDLESHLNEIITDSLWLGDTRGRCSSYLEHMKFDVVVNCCNIKPRKYFEDKIEYIHFDLVDSSTENIEKHFIDFFKIVDKFIEDKKRVYVHCFAGISRSATLVISYIMKKRSIGYEEALKYVKERRDEVNPNPGFVKQLKDYEKHLSKLEKEDKK